MRDQVKAWASFCVFLLLISCYIAWETRAASPGTKAQAVAPQPRTFPKELSGALPFDVDIDRVRALIAQGKIADAHAEFDILAWQAFLALNWPGEGNGQPSRSLTIANTTAPRVWDFWRPADTIFLSGGAPPAKWTGQVEKSTRYRWKSAWRQHTTAASSLEAFSGPLVDQNGNWVRYQIRVNREEFEYIAANRLYSQDGQIEFSRSNQVELPANVGRTSHGAIEIKLAWKELGKDDDSSRFYTRDIVAEVAEPPSPDGKPMPAKKFKAGLVGMHISMKTESSPEWIWSTFEHVDNVRVNKYADGRPTHPNFFDPHKPQPVNVLPAPNAIQDPDTGAFRVVSDTSSGSPNRWVESLTKTPVQVQRVLVPTQAGLNPMDAALNQVTKDINAQVQQLLAASNSVFQYYELIDTQWPIHPSAPAFAGGAGSAPESISNKTPGDMVPVFLVNTTMETYFQKGWQPAGSLEQDDRLAATAAPIDSTEIFATESCVGCHYSSGITIGFKKDLATGLELVDKNGIPTPVYGENNHFGKTGNASFSWMLQLEPKAKPRDIHDPTVKIQE